MIQAPRVFQPSAQRNLGLGYAIEHPLHQQRVADDLRAQTNRRLKTSYGTCSREVQAYQAQQRLVCHWLPSVGTEQRVRGRMFSCSAANSNPFTHGLGCSLGNIKLTQSVGVAGADFDQTALPLSVIDKAVEVDGANFCRREPQLEQNAEQGAVADLGGSDFR